jgi:uncharacterized protein with von Willebrand factor type A (vWA) domain
MLSRFTYSRWDGTQKGFDLDADQIMSEITDDLLYHGDLNAALRRMMQNGFADRSGDDVQGLRELMEKLRQRRRELVESADLGNVVEDLAQRLRDIVETERQQLGQNRRDAQQSGDPQRAADASDQSANAEMELDLLPPDLPGQVKSLQNYDFASSEAKQAFDELVEELRTQLMSRVVNQMAGSMANPDPEQLQRMKDMMADLNSMLADRASGKEPSSGEFDEFMGKHGDFFPENPRNLDELLEQMARRMAAMQRMLNSMSPEQRAQLEGLAQQLLEDMDLSWQMSELSANLQSLFPQMGWNQGYDMQGMDPLDFAGAMDLFDQLADLDQLEQLMRGAANPGALADVDVERARELLGDQAGESLERLAEIQKMLTDAGLATNREGRLELTSRAIRRLGQNALGQLFTKLMKERAGQHPIEELGSGHERSFDSKPYEFGDPFHLDINRTIRNAITRTGGGTPVRLTPDDFEVERTESVTRSATVLMLDLSLSMPMRDNFLSAKKVTMALHSLISSMYPRDYLGIVGFAASAQEITAAQLPEVSWDYDYGTNMQHGLGIARRLLARQSGTKQIIMITDGEPTAHLRDDGSVFFNYPPVPETVNATLAEVLRCTKEQIRINTFMLDASHALRRFVEQMTELNRGRAFFTTPETLGDYVLVDFLEHKRVGSTGGRTRRAS